MGDLVLPVGRLDHGLESGRGMVGSVTVARMPSGPVIMAHRCQSSVRSSDGYLTYQISIVRKPAN